MASSLRLPAVTPPVASAALLPASCCGSANLKTCWRRITQAQHGTTIRRARTTFTSVTRGTLSPWRKSSGASGAASAAVASVVGGKPKKKEVVIPEPDYRIPLVLLGLSGSFVYQDNLLAAAPVGLLGLLLLFQTTRIRFVFEEEAMEVKIGDQLQESGENTFVGGKNRWKYSTFVNWEFWWPDFPILVYFKETQTRPEGQVHFFPIIFNGEQLYNVMVERAGVSKTSGPKDP